jgi:hypothetical protein
MKCKFEFFADTNKWKPLKVEEPMIYNCVCTLWRKRQLRVWRWPRYAQSHKWRRWWSLCEPWCHSISLKDCLQCRSNPWHCLLLMHTPRHGHLLCPHMSPHYPASTADQHQLHRYGDCRYFLQNFLNWIHGKVEICNMFSVSLYFTWRFAAE